MFIGRNKSNKKLVMFNTHPRTIGEDYYYTYENGEKFMGLEIDEFHTPNYKWLTWEDGPIEVKLESIEPTNKELHYRAKQDFIDKFNKNFEKLKHKPYTLAAIAGTTQEVLYRNPITLNQESC